ncbi:MAG: hypothetical protein KGL37_09135, partial [Acidobacteriota bacterium]|nr:hypothetical protein [Acidobacteriota bacterium]
RGLFVADILYLNPEGAPSVFFPPRSAFRPGLFADRRGYNFDGCAPETLIARASVRNGRIVFPDGMSYRLLVLPRFRTMTPRLLAKLVELVEGGAALLGAPPDKSPSLENYPGCDRQIRELAAKLWPQGEVTAERRAGQGRVFYDTGAARREAANPLAQARWIWSSQADAAAQGASLYFQRDFSVEEPGSIEAAVVAITADQAYELTLNGRFILASHVEQRVRRADVSALLRSGSNRFTVSVKKNADKSGRSGLIASLDLTSLAGTTTSICTDRQWICSAAEDGPWLAAEELGAYDMPPWKLNNSSIEQGDIYPSYAVTAGILEKMGVGSDFESDAPLRYIHRRDGEEDFYFIANGEAREQTAHCSFRVADRQPEWWDALTGERRDLPVFRQRGGRTEIPMRLEPFESGFVVFRKPLTQSSGQRGVNFPRFETVATLAAPWQVGFDPKWGGPEQVTFSRLDDWTQRPEEGIRNYSGKAAYRTTFDCGRLDSSLRYYFSLGRVANIALIKLNERELGVVWCEPWRIAIPAGLLRPRGNALEIVVANLWINRLIADSGLPPQQRLTWTTSNPFHPGDRLVESGLLGPVTLQALTPHAV